MWASIVADLKAWPFFLSGSHTHTHTHIHTHTHTHTHTAQLARRKPLLGAWPGLRAPHANPFWTPSPTALLNNNQEKLPATRTMRSHENPWSPAVKTFKWLICFPLQIKMKQFMDHWSMGLWFARSHRIRFLGANIFKFNFNVMRISFWWRISRPTNHFYAAYICNHSTYY